MKRAFYSDTIAVFLEKTPDQVLGELVSGSNLVGGSLDATQSDSWREQIGILKLALLPYRNRGKIHIEYSIPRLGRRVDVVALIDSVVFVLEFKIGERDFSAAAVDQVWDYALDLKNFHETSHEAFIAPVLIASRSEESLTCVVDAPQRDKLLLPIKSSVAMLPEIIRRVVEYAGMATLDHDMWERGRYSPTPTIVEAAMALYSRHSVAEISRSDASAINLTQTAGAVSDVIRASREEGRKSICFVTGVPGAGKTLVGLKIATEHIDKQNDLYSVYLSGNGPLVKILHEALARDKLRQEKEAGRKMKKGDALREVKMFVQAIHHFRDDCLVDAGAPIEHVVLFDEAQRAWNERQTASFMLRKKKRANFNRSEPEFLISCLDRHRDWAVVVCLVGGGQEINTGEAGISEWIESVLRSYPDWRVYLSSRLTDGEYGAGEVLRKLEGRGEVFFRDELHLAVSMRSFRAENVSLLVKQLLDLEDEQARRTLRAIGRYPIAITRELPKAKKWLKDHARGSERYGLIVSSQAQRLKPHAIDVRSPMDPVHWFLDGKEDVRSSFYLEDVATEFDVQGLELDWACVTWDADFRFGRAGWEYRSFCGDSWNYVRAPDRQKYLKNAYRVLLTRARQGMVIVVPQGDACDPTRKDEFYDPTFEYLRGIGFEEI